MLTLSTERVKQEYRDYYKKHHITLHSIAEQYGGDVPNATRQDRLRNFLKKLSLFRKDVYKRQKQHNTQCRGLSIYIGTDSQLVQEKMQGCSVSKDPGEFWIGYVGALGHSYDIKTVILAVKELEKAGYSNIVLKVMGEGVLDVYKRQPDNHHAAKILTGY